MHKKHELHKFFENISRQMAEDYKLIQKRVLEDPGTAGDQSEATWAALIKEWLPEGYSVVTKGRLLGADGETSPQVDVIVLKPNYPKFLKSQKYYIIDGVAAVFECKTTLRKGHLEKAMTTAVAIAKLKKKPTGSIKKELLSPVIFGVLAHSHIWKGDKRKIVNKITNELHDLASKHASEPRELPELICIADLAGWRLGHAASCQIFLHEIITPDILIREAALLLLQKDYEGFQQKVYRTAECISLYVDRPHSEYQQQFYSTGIDCNSPIDTWINFSPIGAFVAALWDKLAYRDESLLDICNYFSDTHIPASSGGINMAGGKLSWARSVLSQDVWDGITRNNNTGDWRQIYF